MVVKHSCFSFWESLGYPYSFRTTKSRRVGKKKSQKFHFFFLLYKALDKVNCYRCILKCIRRKEHMCVKKTPPHGFMNAVFYVCLYLVFTRKSQATVD